jgi:hypothetical protein
MCRRHPVATFARWWFDSALQLPLCLPLRRSDLFKNILVWGLTRGCGSLDFRASSPSPPGPLSPKRGEGEVE